jgi:hypothetical protein
LFYSKNLYCLFLVAPPILNPPLNGFLDPVQPRYIGENLHSVDPFNYTGPGVIRFGPSFTFIGPHMPDIPPGAGVFDPTLIGGGLSNIKYSLPNSFTPM